jgi:hypothetical protein
MTDTHLLNEVEEEDPSHTVYSISSAPDASAQWLLCPSSRCVAPSIRARERERKYRE